MKTKIYSRIQILALLTLPLALTASAFAQNVPKKINVNPPSGNIGLAQTSPISVNPTSLDFGIVEFGSTQSSGKILKVQVKNISQKQLSIQTPPVVASNGFFKINVQNRDLNPGEQTTIDISCRPNSEQEVNGTAFIGARVGNQSQLKAAEIQLKCKGIKTFARFNLKMAGLSGGSDEFVDIRVIGDPVHSQVKCVVGSDDAFFGCDFTQLKKGAQITVQSNSPTFQGFSNPSGSIAACTPKGPCSFTLNSDSELTATFKPLPLAEDRPTQVKVRKQGNGNGTLRVFAKNGLSVNTDGLKSSDPARTQIFPRGTLLFVEVKPDTNSKISTMKVSAGNDVKTKADCEGKSTCSFVLQNITEFDVVFDPKRPFVK
jgi:Abnormal spindle-like microcephaly-assoc'd, ASPM-SPD-2-Hydin